jgi:L-alanine-DL-glutamate epimerase-like enolase superfamily enzyme
VRKLQAGAEAFPIRGRFNISRGAKTESVVVLASVTEGGITGRGECVPYARYGESIDGVLAQIESARKVIESGGDRKALAAGLPPGAARNALDCALWDLEAKHAGKAVWQLAGIPAPNALTTAYTLSLEEPAAMEVNARAASDRPLLKIKLGGEGDLARLEAVRRGAPRSTLIIDANEGWSIENYRALAPACAANGVALIEQPFPAGKDAALKDLPHPVPVCADESCHDSHSLADCKGKYDAINIKLDKTGGLTEALALKTAAHAQGFRLMVGCMVGTSLAMAPALLVAQGAEFVDLDGPLLLARDREPGLTYRGSIVEPSTSSLWG